MFSFRLKESYLFE